MDEKHITPLWPKPLYYAWVARNLGLGLLAIGVCLGIGMAGYHFIEQLSWIDAFLNASMILSGMGPVNPMQTNAGKIFAGCYALFSGLALITIMGMILAPVVHRFLHKFHLDVTTVKKPPGKT
jgi:hypothetical protein